MTNIILVSSIIFIIIILFVLRTKDKENFYESDSLVCQEPPKIKPTQYGNNENNKKCSDYNNKCTEKTAIKVNNQCPDMEKYVLRTSVISEDKNCPACICPKISGSIDCNNDNLNATINDQKKQIKDLNNTINHTKIKDCGKEKCREIAKENPGYICSRGTTPCITIERPIQFDEKTCPVVEPCRKTPPKIIKIKEPCDKDCGKKYKIVGIKTVESKRKILELVQKMLDDPNDQNLDKLNEVKELLDDHNLMSHDNLEKQNKEYEDKIKHLKKRLHHTTLAPTKKHHRDRETEREREREDLDELRRLIKEKNNNNDNKNEINNNIKKIADLESKLKNLENEQKETPSPTSIAQVLNNDNNNNNNNEQYPSKTWENNDNFLQYSKCLV
jgi:hypothetical protein